ncbi:hypothetical protein ACQ4PT_064280 [Festuca glaucescens]
MAAAAWDVLERTANVAQMLAMLVAVFTSILRVQHNKRRCAELERCTRRLRSLLQWPPAGSGSGSGSGAALLCSEMGGPVITALGDAAGLVDSYNKSTLWRRVWSGGRTATQLRDMQDVIDSYCGLLLFVNAHLLLQQATHRRHPIPPSSGTISEVNGRSHSASAQAVTNCPADTGTSDTDDVGQGQERIDSDPATGCERDVPALLTIVISNA